jgi:hypothetical protein
MTARELKKSVINAVEKRLTNKDREKILFIKIVKSGDKNAWTEIIFWYPRKYVLFASRFIYKKENENHDGFIGPFPIIANHRFFWKSDFSFLDKKENNTEWLITEEKVIEVKSVGADDFGFYYHPKHQH